MRAVGKRPPLFLTMRSARATRRVWVATPTSAAARKMGGRRRRRRRGEGKNGRPAARSGNSWRGRWGRPGSRANGPRNDARRERALRQRSSPGGGGGRDAETKASSELIQFRVARARGGRRGGRKVEFLWLAGRRDVEHGLSGLLRDPRPARARAADQRRVGDARPRRRSGRQQRAVLEERRGGEPAAGAQSASASRRPPRPRYARRL